MKNLGRNASIFEIVNSLVFQGTNNHTEHCLQSIRCYLRLKFDPKVQFPSIVYLFGHISVITRISQTRSTGVYI